MIILAHSFQLKPPLTFIRILPLSFTMHKTLVVLLHGIGDSLMAAPALHALKQTLPHSSITVMTIRRSAFSDLWKHNPDVDEVISSSGDLSNTGKIIGLVMAEVKGKADGKTVVDLVRQKILAH